MNTANRLCYHSRADSREVTVAHLCLTVHASDEICKEGYHCLEKVENGIVAAKCEFNSAFIIWATCFWISWQESLLHKEKKIRSCRKNAAVGRVICQFISLLQWS